METKDKMEKEMKSNKWKTIAIIFIVLFIVENLGAYVLFKPTYDYLKDNAICSNEICASVNAYTFTFDNQNKFCSCEDENGKVLLQQVII